MMRRKRSYWDGYKQVRYSTYVATFIYFYIPDKLPNRSNTGSGVHHAKLAQTQNPTLDNVVLLVTDSSLISAVL